jgi:hypothetical protein
VYLDRPCRVAIELDPKPTTTSANTAMSIRRASKAIVGGYIGLVADGGPPSDVRTSLSRLEAVCWAHARRPFFAIADIEENARRKAAGKKEIPLSPIAIEVMRRIDALTPPRRWRCSALLGPKHGKASPRRTSLCRATCEGGPLWLCALGSHARPSRLQAPPATANIGRVFSFSIIREVLS